MSRDNPPQISLSPIRLDEERKDFMPLRTSTMADRLSIVSGKGGWFQDNLSFFKNTKSNFHHNFLKRLFNLDDF
jgi:hypothetical protein